MRDPERIGRIIEQLRQVWLLVPDWRFTQLILNAAETTARCSDVFYLEDDEFEAKLQKLALFIQNASASD